MLMTEGIDYDYIKEIFVERNWKKDYPVRIFTYQIGHDINDAKELEWIACTNMGYWANMTYMGDIREKMLNYLNVMSRPINLTGKKSKKYIWSYLHVDLADRRLSNWLWKKFEGIRQREVFLDHVKRDFWRQHKVLTSKDYMLLKETHDYMKYQNETMDYKYMTTVSLPVYGRRENEYELVGVAGVDVPLHLFKALIPFERLGVNGYAFIVTNNGYVLFHPDHRAEFQNILKPTFNRVDILEVEILNDQNEPRIFGDSIVKFREKLVNQNESATVTFDVKYPLHDNRRVMLAKRHYYFSPIGPFTLGVVLPDKYGFDIVIKSKLEYPPVESTSYLLTSSLWKAHPDWVYCKRCRGSTPEDKIRDAFSSNEKSELLKSLYYDMEVTKWFDDYGGIDKREDDKYILDYQVHKVFLATYSGLTRWRNFVDKDHIQETDKDSFAKMNNRAIDEDWYRRAVELNFENEDIFIYSVPFETSGYENNTMISSTKAIFASKGKLKTPVAVVGLQFNHREMYEIYNEITTKCGSDEKCRITCKQEELDCYILDNNAYIVLSDEPEYIGRYLGDIRPDIMNDLIEDGVYITTRMFDYQAICQKEPPEPLPEEERVLKRKQKAAENLAAAKKAAKEAAARSAATSKPTTASTVFIVLDHFASVKNWLVNLVLFFINLVVSDDTRYISNKPDMIAFNKLEIVKTVPTPCDQERYLFNVNKHQKFPTSPFRTGIKFVCSWPYVIDKIPNTNLLFLATNSDEADACKDRSSKAKYFTEPREITYQTPTFANISFPCYIATKNNYTRRMYMDCYKRNHKEDHLNQQSRFYCGHTWY
nr:voltage-dependent calcium channel subunit alpha-2/delta-3-like [Leptinotarsa decemlineata]